MVVFNDVEKCNILGGVADKGFCIVEMEIFNHVEDDVSCYDLDGHKRAIDDRRFCFFPLERVNDFSVDDLWGINRKRAISEYQRNYREEHRDEIAEYWKKYREEHRDEILERMKKYYEEHKDERLEYQRNYREEHKDEKAERAKKYYEEHKDEKAERAKKYYEEHKDEIAERKRKYHEEHKDELRQRARDHYYLKKYGMTEAEYKANKKQKK